VELDRVLPNEDKVRLHFFLPGDPKPFQLDAEILRAEFSGTVAKYGLRFLNAGPDEKKRIEHFVHRLRARELI
jgi:PilZ domain-containing protein